MTTQRTRAPQMKRVGDNLYRKGTTYYAAAVPPGSRRLRFMSLGQTTKMRARELLPTAIAEIRGERRPEPNPEAPEWALEVVRRSRRDELLDVVNACRAGLERAVDLHADERAIAATAIAALEGLEVTLRDDRRARRPGVG